MPHPVSVTIKRLGVRYDYAMTGEDALMMLGDAEDQKDPYKLCMIDWKMPEMDGIEVTKQIREVFGDDAIVIIVSACLNHTQTDTAACRCKFDRIG